MVELQTAVKAWPYDLLRPETGLAGDATISSVWIREGRDPEVLIQYVSGIVLTLTSRSGAQPTSAYASAQQSDGVPGRIVTLNGVDVFEVPSSEEDYGSIRIVVGDQLLVLAADNSVSAGDLRAAALSALESAAA